MQSAPIPALAARTFSSRCPANGRERRNEMPVSPARPRFACCCVCLAAPAVAAAAAGTRGCDQFRYRQFGAERHPSRHAVGRNQARGVGNCQRQSVVGNSAERTRSDAQPTVVHAITESAGVDRRECSRLAPRPPPPPAPPAPEHRKSRAGRYRGSRKGRSCRINRPDDP